MDDVENILKEDMHVEKPVECDGSHEGNIVDANVSINLSQQQLQLTSPCSACGKITTKKDRVLECSKCKTLYTLFVFTFAWLCHIFSEKLKAPVCM